VRVDVLYAGFSDRKKGLVNAIGSVCLGLPLCWTILLLGMSSQASIITSPLLALEVTQSGFGLYIKYLMAAFLAVFAVTMLIQFAAYFLESVADYRGDPGKHKTAPVGAT
jgi:TRAP-type mannitol/chloroaromatic compound transport system permease small subunit